MGGSTTPIWSSLFILGLLSSVGAQEMTFSERISPENFALGFALATDLQLRGMVFNVIALFFLGMTILLGILFIKYTLKVNSRVYLGIIHCLVFLFTTILTPLFYQSLTQLSNISLDPPVLIVLLVLPLPWFFSLFFLFQVVFSHNKTNVKFAVNLSGGMIPIVLLFSFLYTLALSTVKPANWISNALLAWIVFPIAALIPYTLLSITGLIVDRRKRLREKKKK